MPDLKAIKSRGRSRLKASNAEIEALMLRVRRLLDRGIDSIELSKDANPVDIANSFNQLLASLRSAGLDKEVKKLESLFADELESIQERFRANTKKDFPITSFDVQSLQVLVDSQVTQAGAQIEKYIGDVRQQVLITAITGNRPDIGAIRDSFGDKVFANLETEINTTLRGYSRAVSKQKADEAGIDLFLYFGPDDDLTRPFCNKVLTDRDPPIYTTAEINAMDNGQDLDVFAFGGGYNCRHSWEPVSESLAKELGYGG